MTTYHSRWCNHPQYKAIMYGDLVGDTNASAIEVLNFLDCDRRHDLASFHVDAQQKDSISESQKWQHALIEQPPDASRINAFEEELTNFERRSIEGLCRVEMATLFGDDMDARLLDRARAYLRLVPAKIFGRGDEH